MFMKGLVQEFFFDCQVRNLAPSTIHIYDTQLKLNIFEHLWNIVECMRTSFEHLRTSINKNGAAANAAPSSYQD